MTVLLDSHMSYSQSVNSSSMYSRLECWSTMNFDIHSTDHAQVCRLYNYWHKLAKQMAFKGDPYLNSNDNEKKHW